MAPIVVYQFVKMTAKQRVAISVAYRQLNSPLQFLLTSSGKQAASSSQQYLAPFASFWERSASYLHRRGVVLGNYRSLYAFKAKFHPHWESRYLFVSEKQAAPRILLALVQVHSGGWSSMLKESCCRIVSHIKLVVSSL